MGYNYTVAGVDSVIARFLEVPEVAHEALGNALEDGLRDIQYSAGDFVAVDTGNGRATLLDPAAVKVDRETLRGEFGLITPELRKRAWYLSFVEWGTKAYPAGGKRISGMYRGRFRFRKVARTVPARPAKPFMKPALDVNIGRLRDLHTKAIKGAIDVGWKRGVGKIVGFVVK
jgi:HK97 gp10 family phage protein